MPSGARASRRGAVAGSRIRKALFFDDFNRANGNLGAPDYTVISGTPAINANQVQGGNGHVLRATDCLTDDEFTAVKLGSVVSGTLTLYLRTGPTGWPTIVADITPSNGNWAIVTDPTSGGGDHATRASGSFGSGVLVTGAWARFDAVGNSYFVSADGVSASPWADSGGAVTPGPTRRRVGFKIGSGSSMRIDEWQAGDL